MGDEYADARVSDVEPRIRPQVERYLDELSGHLSAGRGLLLTGTFGTGKTSILALVMRRFYELGMRECWFVYAQDVFSALVGRDELSSRAAWRAENATLLLLDGFGEAAEYALPWTQFELLVEKRKSRRLTTCISANLSLRDLKARPEYARVLERWKTCCYPFEIVGPSRRQSLEPLT